MEQGTDSTAVEQQTESVQKTAATQEDYEQKFLLEQKRRRGAQSAYSKLAAEKKALELELEELRGNAKSLLSDEQKEHLGNLANVDPDAYYAERLKLEKSASEQFNSKRAERMTKAQEEVAKQLIIEQLEEAETVLKEQFDDFDAVVTKENLAEHLPPSFSKKLKAGEESAEDFLVRAYRFLKTDKTIFDPGSQTTVTNIGKVPGSRSPNPARQQDVASSYAQTIF